ncbi:DUF4198 domain-containing protein [Terasakiella sp. A23]|uniref:DUF4198 domain-containing protein n=1 Tax=Terasakiella sp. FCG-A23 TaxID=3080561 RepID=UPI002954F10E|nr:DUF4198 domain-containing protein [Terasakiella sp. A23]MDV7339550.1 DUF4198 domain-containing protein [Terasakiella sp. A23]
MRISLFSLFAAAALLLSPAAQAHFQLIYTPDSNQAKAGTVPLKLIFWHPMENGHAMDMGKPEEFYSVFKGKKTDLMDTLKPITFNGTSNSAKAYDGTVKLKRNGDYALVTVPAPYYEESEDIYIQQITKVFINKGETPSDWAEPVGLKTEILPLNKPYGAVVGSTFTGVVLKNGKPAAGVEIEIEHMVAEPDMKANKPSSDASSAVPGGAIAVVSDANGQFTFGIPKAGYWGFAALGSGPDTEFKGKELSQDAVLWIQAFDLK